MTLPSLESRTDEALHQEIKSLRGSECETIAEIVLRLHETEVLTLAQGQPKLEVERIAARYGKAKEPKRGGSVRVVKRSCPQSAVAPDLFVKREEPTEERFSVTFELTKEESAMLEQARALVGVRQIKDVVVKTAKESVARRTRSVRTTRAVSTVKVIKPLKSRHITNAVKREVRERDGERCTYVSPDGRRCSECRGLQFDHVQPFSLGGENEAQNLRLVCAGHNQLFAERVFGREKILNFARASGGK